MTCTRHSYLHGVVESFKHTHALGAELEVHGAFHGQGEALVLHGVLPTDDHHAREHLLGEEAAPVNRGGPFGHRVHQHKQASFTSNLFKDADMDQALITDQTPGGQGRRKGPGSGPGPGEVGWELIITGQAGHPISSHLSLPETSSFAAGRVPTKV